MCQPEVVPIFANLRAMAPKKSSVASQRKTAAEKAEAAKAKKAEQAAKAEAAKAKKAEQAEKSAAEAVAEAEAEVPKAAETTTQGSEIPETSEHPESKAAAGGDAALSAPSLASEASKSPTLSTPEIDAIMQEMGESTPTDNLFGGVNGVPTPFGRASAGAPEAGKRRQILGKWRFGVCAGMVKPTDPQSLNKNVLEVINKPKKN